MTDAAATADHGSPSHGSDSHGHAGPHHGPMYYVKIWALLLVLLMVSILGPMLGHPLLTLITAFGIAIVKAYIVAAFFMHLNIEKKYVSYLILSAVMLITVFWGYVAPDVQNHEGQRWVNVAAKAETARVLKLQAEHPEGEHGGGEHAAGEHGAEHGDKAAH